MKMKKEDHAFIIIQRLKWTFLIQICTFTAFFYNLLTNSTKLGTKDPWAKWIHHCSNKLTWWKWKSCMLKISNNLTHADMHIILSSDMAEFVEYKNLQNLTSLVVFSSPELKAQVSFSDHLSSVFCLSVRPSVCL